MQQVMMAKAIKNDEWIAADNKADPDILPQIPGPTILVRPVSVKKKTKGGILIPDALQDDMSYLTTVGKVLAVGETAYKESHTTDSRFPNGAWCKVGDYVTYDKNVGTKLYYKGIQLISMYDDAIRMVVEDPKELDLTYDLSN
jgi:co-chaperonin GroES (HSP10)